MQCSYSLKSTTAEHVSTAAKCASHSHRNNNSSKEIGKKKASEKQRKCQIIGSQRQHYLIFNYFLSTTWERKHTVKITIYKCVTKVSMLTWRHQLCHGFVLRILGHQSDDLIQIFYLDIFLSPI